MNEYFVYIYLSTNDVPYYIGMGKRKRIMRWHNYVNVPNDWDSILMIRNLSQEEAWNLEKVLIKAIGRECLNEGLLKNLAQGGPSQKSGWHHSPETKRRISEKLKGVFKSKKHVESMRNKIFTIEHREKIRQAGIGRPRDGRYEKMGKTKSYQRWFNNGKITKMCVPGMEPTGFLPGRISWVKKEKTI